MVIKPQDIVVLSKLIASEKQHKDWTQNSMANELCLSPSQVNSALKRLVPAGLMSPRKNGHSTKQHFAFQNILGFGSQV